MIFSFDCAAVFPSPRAKWYSKQVWGWGEVFDPYLIGSLERACLPPLSQRGDAADVLGVCRHARRGSSSTCCERCRTAGGWQATGTEIPSPTAGSRRLRVCPAHAGDSPVSAFLPRQSHKCSDKTEIERFLLAKSDTLKTKQKKNYTLSGVFPF